ncbi:MAG: NnrU family protein, partial [Bosea sp. (in: a-proteobacteria)]
MKLLVLGLVLFLGGHAVSMKRDLRASLIARFGDGGYKALYSIVSLLGLVLIVHGFGSYRASGYIPVWEPPAFTRHI